MKVSERSGKQNKVNYEDFGKMKKVQFVSEKVMRMYLLLSPSVILIRYYYKLLSMIMLFSVCF